MFCTTKFLANTQTLVLNSRAGNRIMTLAKQGHSRNNENATSWRVTRFLESCFAARCEVAFSFCGGQHCTTETAVAERRTRVLPSVESHRGGRKTLSNIANCGAGRVV